MRSNSGNAEVSLGKVSISRGYVLHLRWTYLFLPHLQGGCFPQCFGSNTHLFRGVAPDGFNQSYGGKVLSRGNVHRDPLCAEDGPGAYKNVCSAKAQPTNIAEKPPAVSPQKFPQLSAPKDNPFFSPLENYLHHPG